METTKRRRPLWRRPVVQIVLGAAVVALVIALSLFQPWKLFIDQRVNEALPTVAGQLEPAATEAPATTTTGAPGATTEVPAGPTGVPTATSTAEPPAATTQVPSPPAEPVVLESGEFISHEHASSGSVSVLQLADGSRVLRLENLDTSNGPALKVWLTDAPVLEGRDGWYVFDDGQVADLGPLKGNIGSSNYPIPADVDLTQLTSVSIWCDRFNVSFAAAELVGS